MYEIDAASTTNKNWPKTWPIVANRQGLRDREALHDYFEHAQNKRSEIIINKNWGKVVQRA
jgi:hypothetical protein